MSEEDILATQTAFTSAVEEKEGFNVSFDINNKKFYLRRTFVTIEEANKFRRELAVSLLKFNGIMRKDSYCLKCKRKKREDW